MATTGPTGAGAAAAAAETSVPKIGASAAVQELVEDGEGVADALERLAGRVRKLSQRFTQLGPQTGTAVGVAAELVSDVMQGTGALGTLLWTLTSNAGTYDREQAARIAAQPGKDSSSGS